MCAACMCTPVLSAQALDQLVDGVMPALRVGCDHAETQALDLAGLYLRVIDPVGASSAAWVIPVVSWTSRSALSFVTVTASFGAYGSADGSGKRGGMVRTITSRASTLIGVPT
jgi:hypothetical protein